MPRPGLTVSVVVHWKNRSRSTNQSHQAHALPGARGQGGDEIELEPPSRNYFWVVLLSLLFVKSNAPLRPRCPIGTVCTAIGEICFLGL